MAEDRVGGQPLMRQILDRMLEKLEGCVDLDAGVLDRVAKLCEEGGLSSPDDVVAALRTSREEQQ